MKSKNKRQGGILEQLPYGELEVRLGKETTIFHVPASDLKKAMPDWKALYRHESRKSVSFESVERSLEAATGGSLSPGEKVRYLRKQKDLTQAQLAEKLGISQGSLASIESGSRNLGRELAKGFGRVFGVDFRVFL